MIRNPAARGIVQPFPRGSFAGRMLLLVITLMVTLGAVAVASASEGQAAANGGTTWSIVLHDVVYLGFGLFALYVVARIRLDQLVRRAPLFIVTALRKP